MRSIEQGLTQARTMAQAILDEHQRTIPLTVRKTGWMEGIGTIRSNGESLELRLGEKLLREGSDEVLDFIVAHEMGHYVLGHLEPGASALPGRLFLLTRLLALIVMGHGFGHVIGATLTFKPHAIALGMLVMAVAMGVVLLVSWLFRRYLEESHRHEFEADDFAARHARKAGGGELFDVWAKSTLLDDALVAVGKLFGCRLSTHPGVRERKQNLGLNPLTPVEASP